MQRCREFIKPTKRPGKRCHGTRQCTNPMLRLVWRRQGEGAVPVFNPEPRLHQEIAYLIVREGLERSEARIRMQRILDVTTANQPPHRTEHLKIRPHIRVDDHQRSARFQDPLRFRKQTAPLSGWQVFQPENQRGSI